MVGSMTSMYVPINRVSPTNVTGVNGTRINFSPTDKSSTIWI